MDERPPGQDLAVRPGVPELLAAAETYAQAAKSPNTQRAYASDWRTFCAWCDERGASPMPAQAGTVALFLTEAAPTHTVSTLARRLAAIRAAHKASGEAAPRSAVLDDVWAGIRRTHGRPPRKKAPLGVKALQKVVKKTPPGLRGLRDIAIVLVGYGMASRRSELAALEMDGPGAGQVRVRFVPKGLEISIDRSKGDQTGQGAVLGVAYGKKICAVIALRAWLEAARIREGPVFRPINRHGQVQACAMSGQAIADVIKASVKRVGLNPDDFGGHSVRRGFITEAIASGARVDKVMGQSRHSRFDTMRGYIADAERFKDNPTGKLM